MAQGLYSGVSGLAIGVGLYKGTSGLWSGANGLITPPGGATLSLNFLNTSTLDSRITFTRSTTATFVGSDGLIQTAAINAPRFDYSPTTLASKGLLIEEQRTNLFLNSKIDGTNLVTQNVTTTATAYTISFYGTGTITLTGTSTAGPIAGTGAYPTRTTLTFTPTAGTLTCTVTGTVQYAQIEAGAFATSYIPTAAATVTRAADVATMTGTNFSSWYNQSAGTIVASVLSAPVNTIAQQAVYVSDGASTNSIFTRRSGGGTVATAVTTGGVVQADVSSGSLIAGGAAYTYAFAYVVNDLAESLNGSAVGTDALATIPTVNQMNLGSSAAITQILNGHIRYITYYPQRLPDTTLQSLTA